MRLVKENKVTDYQDFTTRKMSIEARRKLNVGDIWSNAAQCLLCKDIIRSKNQHNMVYCKCGNAFVDGGSWDGRYGSKNLKDIKLLTEYYDEKE